jgi:hypothetical protein
MCGAVSVEASLYLVGDTEQEVEVLFVMIGIKCVIGCGIIEK